MTDGSSTAEASRYDEHEDVQGDSAETEPQSRVGLLWARKWLILLAALVVGGLSGAFAATRPMEYQAQSTVRVSLLQTEDSGSEIATAANEYAAQYAQIVNSDPVLGAASKSTGVSISRLRSRVTATPINKYNIIGITVVTSSSRQASDQANAVATALVDYVSSSGDTAIKSSSAAVSAQQKSLNTAIDTAQADVDRYRARLGTAGDTADAVASALSSSRSYLSSLITLRQTLYLSPVRELLQSRPSLTVLDAPKTGSAQPRRVAAYAAVGAVVGGVIVAELFLLVAQARGRRRH